jgi:hypothetical protein
MEPATGNFCRLEGGIALQIGVNAAAQPQRRRKHRGRHLGVARGQAALRHPGGEFARAGQLIALQMLYAALREFIVAATSKTRRFIAR